ncbi:MAG: flagellar biosynthesis protein FlgJ, partial [Thiogranum sp.]
GMVPRRRDTEKSHELAVFDSPEDSVESYIHNLNSHDVYEPLRNIRAELKTTQQPVTGIRLVDGLGEYSEKGNEYVEELRSMIRDNDLTSFDTE